MSDQRALESALRSWLGEDSREAVDGVLESVLGRLDAHPQRRRRSLIPGWLAGRPSGARALVVAVGLLVLALLAISLLPVAVPQPVSQTDAPSNAPSVEVAPTNPASDVPSPSIDPTIEPSADPSPMPSPTQSTPPTPEPTFAWSNVTGYRVDMEGNVWPGQLAAVHIHGVPVGAVCTLMVVYEDGSPADTGPVTHPDPGEWRWEWLVPIDQAWDNTALADVDTTCAYQGQTTSTSSVLVVESLWTIVGFGDCCLAPNEAFILNVTVYTHPDDLPIDFDCTLTLTWPESVETVHDPHVTTHHFDMTIVMSDSPVPGTHPWEITCIAPDGRTRSHSGTIVVE